MNWETIASYYCPAAQHALTSPDSIGSGVDLRLGEPLPASIEKPH
jgi:hypothetical protein